MTADPVTAISAVSTTDAAQRYQAGLQPRDLSAFDPAAGGAHLSLEPSVQAQAATSPLNVRTVATAFADGMNNGFVMPAFDHLMQKVELSKQPGSGITTGELTADLLMVQAKVAVSDVFAKTANKLAEGLHTLVTKQG
jgi:hypothetical protein